MKQRKKHLVIGLLTGIIIFFVIPMTISVIIYEKQFGSRNETAQHLKYEASDFDNLEQTPAYFKSNHGQLLAGYVYTNPEVVHPNGVIIVAHGLGAGHNTYLPEIYYLTQQGYTVFAYDGTGNDESEGESIVGLPQAVIDLDYAINYVKDDEQFDGLPIMLYGHSLGGYAVIAVLNQHTDITAVVERSGFYESIDIIDQQGSQIYGSFFHLLKPYFRLYERIKFGEYASLNGLEVLENTNTNVMFMHSKDDEVISYNQYFSKYEDLFGSKVNFKFISYQNRGHDVVVNEALTQTLREQIENDYGSYDSMPEEARQMYSDVLYDLEYRLDLSVMEQIIDFYNQWVVKEYE